MTFTPIANDDVRTRLRQPYNPPRIGSEADERTFRAELFGVRGILNNVLSKHGKEDAFGDADYCLSSDWTFSRAIAVTVTSATFLTIGLIEDIQAALKTIGGDYEVYLSHFMRGVPKWDVFVNARDCLVFGEPIATGMRDKM